MPFKERTRIIPRRNLPKINILPQQRREMPTKEALENLAASMISTGGNKNAIWVVKIVGKKAAREYADFFVKMYGSSEPFDIVPDADEEYYFLIAGHCRLAAYNLTSVSDLPKIRVTFHYPHNQENIAFQAVILQMAENVQNHLPAHVQADSIVAIVHAHEIAFPDAKLSMASIAREIGKSPDTVSTAMKWRGLPEEIRLMVRGGDTKERLHFGAAIELGRLDQAVHDGERLFSRDFVIAKMYSVIAQRISVPTLRAEIDGLIKHQHDIASGADFFLTQGMSIGEMLELEAHSATGRKLVEFRGLVEKLRLYARVVRDNPTLLVSPMGKIFEEGTRDGLLELTSAMGDVADLLLVRQKIDRQTHTKVRETASRIRRLTSTS